MSHIRRVAPLCALALVPTASLVAQQRFEGKIVAQTSFKPGRSSTVGISEKWPKERIDVTNQRGQVIIIVDFNAGTRTVILPAKKEYWEVNIADRARELRRAVEERGYVPGSLTVAVVVTPTTRTATIAGYPCKYYTLGADQKVDMCVATGLGEYLADREVDGASAMGGTPGTDTLYDDLGRRFPGGYFPLQILSRANGPERTVFQVKSITRSSIPDATFAVPAGYTKIPPPQIPA